MTLPVGRQPKPDKTQTRGRKREPFAPHPYHNVATIMDGCHCRPVMGWSNHHKTLYFHMFGQTSANAVDCPAVVNVICVPSDNKTVWVTEVGNPQGSLDWTLPPLTVLPVVGSANSGTRLVARGLQHDVIVAPFNRPGREPNISPSRV
ncbi:hypothetical protein [Rhodopila sp.]|uniref:hypothetical protein n=1 Tax=Rhodopila sp. TaxID=2480087 RepID=UPI003D0A201F